MKNHKCGQFFMGLKLIFFIIGALFSTSVMAAISDTVKQATVSIKLVDSEGTIIERGTGVIITSEGLVMTAHHVVKLAERNKASLIVENEKLGSSDANFYRSDIDLDIALIQLPKDKTYSYLPLASPEHFTEGIKIASYGYDLGQNKAYYQNGQITRNITTDTITASASINFYRGASGGPILPSVCESVVGIAQSGKYDDRQLVPSHTNFVPMNKIINSKHLRLLENSKIIYFHGPCSPWPTLVDGENEYTVTIEMSRLNIPFLYLPSNFTLKFDPQVTSVDWRFTFLEIGENVLIDLSQTSLDSFANNGASERGQAGYGIKGSNGDNGNDGIDGLDGKNISLFGKHVLSLGSAWLKTSGSDGQHGGNGGNGQLGGGSSCGRILREGRTNAGDGGDGGNSGSGGDGGDGSTVLLSRNINTMFLPCPLDCNESVSSDYISGKILVYGSVGCGGRAGNPGNSGAGADKNRDRSCSVRGGADGRRGTRGSNGRHGLCRTMFQ